LKKTFALEKGGPKTIEFSWDIGWKDFTIRQDGEIIGTIENKEALKQGREVTLKDGSRMYVRLNLGIMDSGLEILKDGKPLEGSNADPASRIKSCFGLLILLSVLDILGAAFVVISLPAETYARADGLLYAFVYMFFGFAFIFLALMVKKASLTGLYIAITLIVIEVLFGIGIMAMSGGVESIFPWVIRIVITIYLMSSAKYFREARVQAAS
jgi:hypothetical protein